MVLGDFNTIRLHSEAFGGAPNVVDMEEASNHASLATVNFWTAVRMEEAAMRQKSQIRWLKLDDQNTAFFHRYVRSRQSSNALRSVIDPDGNRLTNYD